jgi:hypothetical protein
MVIRTRQLALASSKTLPHMSQSSGYDRTQVSTTAESQIFHVSRPSRQLLCLADSRERRKEVLTALTMRPWLYQRQLLDVAESDSLGGQSHWTCRMTDLSITHPSSPVGAFTCHQIKSS